MTGRWKPGESGNPKERPKGSSSVTQEEFMKALRNVESDRKINLLEHFFKRALKSDTVLVAVMKKLVPDLKALDMRLDLLIMQNKLSHDEAGIIRGKLAKRFKSGDQEVLPEPVKDDGFVDVNPVSQSVADQIVQEIEDEDEEEEG